MLFRDFLPVLSLVSLARATPRPEAQAKIPQCTNGGTALCCQGTFAGDLPLIRTLAGLTSFPLNPNDVNCIGTSPASANCVGVNTCCQVTGTSALLGVALYCQKPANC